MEEVIMTPARERSTRVWHIVWLLGYGIKAISLWGSIAIGAANPPGYDTTVPIGSYVVVAYPRSVWPPFSLFSTVRGTY